MRRSNPEAADARPLDCFASLAMTDWKLARLFLSVTSPKTTRFLERQDEMQSTRSCPIRNALWFRCISARDASNTIWSYCQRRSKKLRARRFAIAARQCKSQYLGQGSLPVDGAEQPVLERVDGENEIGKCVRPVDQHRDAARRQTFPNAYRPWQRNRNVVAPTIADKCDRLALVGAIIAVRDEIVRDHCSAEKLDGGVLQPGGQRGQPRGVRAIRQDAALRRGRAPARSSDRRTCRTDRAKHIFPERCRRDPGDEGARPPSLPAAGNPSTRRSTS